MGTAHTGWYVPVRPQTGMRIARYQAVHTDSAADHSLSSGTTDWGCFRPWLETILTNAVRKKYGEEKQLTGSNLGLSSCQPLVFFTLCTGASSDPMVNLTLALS
ncbi:hypothetical protein B296_00009802 [Ensete ventricosum]|uniref:Uncharacterized protein n=1 Tax=Ensete ventricosum TaxID=4639 RepID=A0A427AG82_ENSVE|nr:hypothetical protein B296_00009802 [Ensete ventricosum]